MLDFVTTQVTHVFRLATLGALFRVKARSAFDEFVGFSVWKVPKMVWFWRDSWPPKCDDRYFWGKFARLLTLTLRWYDFWSQRCLVERSVSTFESVPVHSKKKCSEIRLLGNSYIQQPNCLRTLWLLLCWLNTCIHDPMTQPIFYHRMVSWDGENPLLKWSNQFMLVKYQFMLADKFLFFTGTVIAFLTVAYLWW